MVRVDNLVSHLSFLVNVLSFVGFMLLVDPLFVVGHSFIVDCITVIDHVTVEIGGCFLVYVTRDAVETTH